MADDFISKVNNLPEKVRVVLMSDLPAEESYRAATRYGLDEENQNKLAKLVGLLFVKEAPLEKLTDIIQSKFALSEGASAGLALAVIKNIFLPIREFFPNAESLIQILSQKAANPTREPKSLGIKSEPAEIKTQSQPLPDELKTNDTIIEKNIVAAVTEKEEIANQAITEKPIQFADSENLRMPTIKNWLLDYKKYRSSFPNQELALIRAKYIIDTPNAKNLSEQEKIIVSDLIKSYDEHTLLPFSQRTGRLMTELIVPKQQEPAPAIPQKIASHPPSSPRFGEAGFPASPPSKDTFREQVADEDLAGPQAARRPIPRLDGNIVNLKDFNDKQ